MVQEIGRRSVLIFLGEVILPAEKGDNSQIEAFLFSIDLLRCCHRLFRKLKETGESCTNDRFPSTNTVSFRLMVDSTNL